jgi:colanic acid biosynthesis glycosyl transferase WcaI
MRILIYTTNYWPELVGIGKFTSEFAEWLTHKSHDVRVVTAPPSYPEWQVQKGYSAWSYRTEYAQGVRIFRCPIWIKQRISGWQRLIHLLSFAISSLPIMLKQIPWNPDIVMVIEPSLFCIPTALLVSKLCQAKSWLHIQDFELEAGFELGMLPNIKRLRWLLFLFERHLMNQFHTVSTISERMSERLILKRVIPDKIVLFPNWVDTSQIYPLSRQETLRASLGFDEDTVIVLYAGTMANKQRLESIIQAAQSLREVPNLQFLLAGEGSRKGMLVEMVQTLALKNIHFLPLLSVSDFNRLLSTADIHILLQIDTLSDLMMPSKLAGMLASGQPVIATAELESAIGRVILNSGGGVLIPPNDLDMLISAIQQLAQTPHKRYLYGRNGRRYAEMHLDKESILEAAYSALIASQERPQELPDNRVTTTTTL